MIFTVTNKDNNKEYNVYDVMYDKAGYPHFLVYKDGQWLRMSAKYFKPLEFISIGEAFADAGGLRPDTYLV